MNRPDYISAEDARMMRFVGNMSDLLSVRFNGASVVHYPRRVIGDFNALARWIAKRLDVDGGFEMEPGQFPNMLDTWQFARLRDEMPGAERFAADQILSDMRAIESAPDWRSNWRPCAQLMVVGSKGYAQGDHLTNILHHDTHSIRRESQMGRVLSCYTLPVTGFVGHGQAILREPDNFVYDARPCVEIRSFCLTDIWRQSVENIFRENVPPFIHTAQRQKAGDPPRLVMVGQ